MAGHEEVTVMVVELPLLENDVGTALAFDWISGSTEINVSASSDITASSFSLFIDSEENQGLLISIAAISIVRKLDIFLPPETYLVTIE